LWPFSAETREGGGLYPGWGKEKARYEITLVFDRREFQEAEICFVNQVL